MRAFITGISGFAGTFLAEHLLGCGDEVAGFSARGEWPDDVTDSLKSVPLFKCDLAQGISTSVRQALSAFQPNAIYHLAAISTPSDCGTDHPSAVANAVNVEGLQEVLRIAERLQPQPRTLFVSSCHVYAPVTAPSCTVDELAPLGPKAGYGMTKLAAERRAADFAKQGLPIITARAFQHTGPRQSLRMVLPDWAHQFASPETDVIEVRTLDAYLDLSDVRDVVRAYRKLIESGKSGEVYNVGTGRTTQSGELLQLLVKLSERKIAVKETQPGRMQQPIADLRKLRSVIDWEPQIPLEQTVADTLRYWRERVAR